MVVVVVSASSQIRLDLQVREDISMRTIPIIVIDVTTIIIEVTEAQEMLAAAKKRLEDINSRIVIMEIYMEMM